jgi:hypothetical protein
MTRASVVQQAGQRGADVSGVANSVIKQPELIAELVEALQAEKGTAKYGYEKVLRLVSERRPDLIYPHFDFFAGLLDCDNNFLKWGAIMTIANLTSVDGRGRFEEIFEQYYAPIPGPAMITAANIIGSSPRIVRAKPRLVGPITQEILKVRKAKYESHGKPSPECRNVAIGHAIEAFDQFFDRIEEQDTVIRFVKLQLKNMRKQVVKRAERFLRTR